jgi:hypothetical protein
MAVYPDRAITLLIEAVGTLETLRIDQRPYLAS